MDFAKKQLEKYGWREGQGLGKNEDGISTAIKPKLKFDNAGVGHDIGEQFKNNWWEKMYSNALSNIQVKNEDGKIKMALTSGNSVDITTNSYAKKLLKSQSKSLEYGSFIKTSSLTDNGLVHYSVSQTDLSEEAIVPKLTVLSDEELLAACNGRTAHKGARHGLKLSGKLSRIEKQEKMLLKKLQNVSICDEKKDLEKKVKKIAKHKEKNKSEMEDGLSVTNLEDDSRSSTSSTSKKKKKRNRERKSVTFSETVTEYHTQDTETAESNLENNDNLVTVIEKTKIKDEEVDNNNTTDTNVLDEGIEQDIEGKGNADCDHKSFEEAQCSSTERLSRAERKLKKKNRATFRFLEELKKSKIDEGALADLHDGCKKCKKRKHLELEDIEVDVELKRYCEYKEIGGEVKKKKSRKMKDKMKHSRREEKKINSIAKSLDQICKISESE